MASNNSRNRQTAKPKFANILDEAEHIIYGDREKTYGDPAVNLRRIADQWNAYLSNSDNVGSGDVTLSLEDVCNMMILLKVARLQNTPGHHDSLVDIAGYAALTERVTQDS